MKIRAIYEFELSDGLHGEDIQDLLKDVTEKFGGKLISWGTK